MNRGEKVQMCVTMKATLSTATMAKSGGELGMEEPDIGRTTSRAVQDQVEPEGRRGSDAKLEGTRHGRSSREGERERERLRSPFGRGPS
jgi:hypothetical protein